MNSIIKWGIFALIVVFALQHPAQAGDAVNHAISSLGTLISNL